MIEIDFEDYLIDEFNVPSPSHLTDHEKILAYERLKIKIIESDPLPDEYTKMIIRLTDYLEV
jgi:hypothetical protein